MPGYKLSRITEEMKQELSVLFRELKDPRICEMLSVVKLSVTNDLSHAKVYVSTVHGMEKTKKSVEGLQSAKGFLRHEIASRLQLRKSPQLEFIADDSIEYGAQITRLLEELDTNRADERE